MVPPLDQRTKDGVVLGAETVTAVEADFKTRCATVGGVSVGSATQASATASVDRNQPWTTDPTGKSLMDHEQGHFDEAEAAARKAQADINKAIKDGSLKGSGATDAAAEADLGNQIQAIINRARQEVSDKNKDGHDDYDADTTHGKKSTEQAAARKRQEAALKSPGTDPAHQIGPQAESKTSKSIHFDAAAQRLTIDNDFIVATLAGASGYVPNPLDAVLGAQVLLPSFLLVGRDAEGGYFFSAEGVNPALQIVAPGLQLLTGGLPYLVYDPVLNLFHGLLLAAVAAWMLAVGWQGRVQHCALEHRLRR